MIYLFHWYLIITCSIANNRQQNDANKFFANAATGCQATDGIYQKIGSNCNQLWQSSKRKVKTRIEKIHTTVIMASSPKATGNVILGASGSKSLLPPVTTGRRVGADSVFALPFESEVRDDPSRSLRRKPLNFISVDLYSLVT
jgi:hypothetical protein